MTVHLIMAATGPAAGRGVLTCVGLALAALRPAAGVFAPLQSIPTVREEVWVSSAVVPFDLRGITGWVEVSIESNGNPSELGCGLLDDRVDADTAAGFPVCTATIRYERHGYAAALGWIQLVRSTDG